MADWNTYILSMCLSICLLVCLSLSRTPCLLHRLSAFLVELTRMSVTHICVVSMNSLCAAQHVSSSLPSLALLSLFIQSDVAPVN